MRVPVIKCDTVNLNNVVYPRKWVEKAFKKMKKDLPVYFGEAEHPEVIGCISDFKFESDGTLVGDISITNKGVLDKLSEKVRVVWKCEGELNFDNEHMVASDLDGFKFGITDKGESAFEFDLIPKQDLMES